MVKLRVSEILKATGGLLLNGVSNQTVTNISTDSRTIRPGDLFLALNGPKFKGGKFISDALKKGAIGYIAQNPDPGPQTPDPKVCAIQVDDTLRALQDIAHYILNEVKPKVVAITGSTGKTSVREMLKSILSLRYEVVASKANYNNEIGLPLTLLELKPSTKMVILEMAMRGMGQISELCQIAVPDIAVITNVGLSHMELLKSEDNIINAKAEIIKGLKKGGTVFLNGDDEATQKLKLRIANGEWRIKKTNVMTFGSDKKESVYFDNVSLDDFARPAFDIRHSCLPAGTATFDIPIKLPVSGKHHVVNACAAAAAAFCLGVTLTDIKRGLESIESTPGRMHVTKANEWVILDDSYNASPASMAVAIETLKDTKARHKVAVLGDMLELGDISLKEHIKLGQLVARSGIHLLFTVGSLGKHIGQAAIEEGMPSSSVHSFSDYSELNREIISFLAPQDAILIKASRAIKLDKVAYYLQKKR